MDLQSLPDVELLAEVNRRGWKLKSKNPEKAWIGHKMTGEKLARIEAVRAYAGNGPIHVPSAVTALGMSHETIRKHAKVLSIQTLRGPRKKQSKPVVQRTRPLKPRTLLSKIRVWLAESGYGYCVDCHTAKSLTDFYLSRGPNRGPSHYYCSACLRRRANARNAR